MITLIALDEVVERHGRAALADPIALTGALRSLPTPPQETEIAALVAAAGSGAVQRMRATLDAGGSAQDARRAAVSGLPGDHGQWACDLLGAALGLLPRDLVGEAPTTVLSSAAPAGSTRRADLVPGRGRHTAVIAVIAVLALGLAGAGVTIALTGDGSPAAEPAPADASTTAPTTTAPTTTPTAPAKSATPSTPTQDDPKSGTVDPRSVFTDPALLAMAVPYLDGPGVSCVDAKESTGVQESVTCDLGSGIVASFRKLLSPAQLDALRKVLLTDNDGALPGSIRTLRWEYVPGKPGVRTGIPVGTPRPGVGTRIRFLDPEKSYSRLYYDEDATGVAVYMQATTLDQQVLRAFWADPDA